MAIRTLTKITRKPEQVAFMQAINHSGQLFEFSVPLSAYGRMTQSMVIENNPNLTLVGGYTRYDYNTPTGLLGEGEYGEDGVDKNGNKQVQMILDGEAYVLPETLVVADDVDDSLDEVMSQKLNRLTR